MFVAKILYCKAIPGQTGTTCTNEMNFGTNHAPGAGSIAPIVDLQSSVHHCATIGQKRKEVNVKV